MGKEGNWEARKLGSTWRSDVHSFLEKRSFLKSFNCQLKIQHKNFIREAQETGKNEPGIVAKPNTAAMIKKDKGAGGKKI